MTPCRLSLRFVRQSVIALLVISAAAVSSMAHGQAASATATRTADVSVYGGYVFSQPDYGLQGRNNNGFLFGGTFNRFVRIRGREWGFGVDARYDHNTGSTVNEGAFAGGLQIQTIVSHKLRVYGGGGMGYGTIHFNYYPIPSDHNYTGDNATIYYANGGLTYAVYRNLDVKADYTYQAWKLGANDYIDPSVFTFGMQYRIPFKAWTGHGHERN